MDWILGGLSDIATDETGTSSFAAENGAIVPVITCNIYPTLTSGIITVEVAQMDSAEFRAEIFDFSGSKTLITELVRLPSQQINLTALSPGPYFIKISVVKTNQCLKTEKIIKY